MKKRNSLATKVDITLKYFEDLKTVKAEPNQSIPLGSAIWHAKVKDQYLDTIGFVTIEQTGKFTTFINALYNQIKDLEDGNQ